MRSALRYWKILFSPPDFEPTSVRNCQFLTQPVRNCQHADPYQVLGLERSEQQWMSPRVNPGGIAKQLSPGWKSISVSVPDVKRSNVVRLKTPLRCNFFWTENIVVYAIDNLWNKFWGESQKHFPQGEKAPLSGCPCTSCERGQRSSPQDAFEVCNFS